MKNKKRRGAALYVSEDGKKVSIILIGPDELKYVEALKKSDDKESIPAEMETGDVTLAATLVHESGHVEIDKGDHIDGYSKEEWKGLTSQEKEMAKEIAALGAEEKFLKAYADSAAEKQKSAYDAEEWIKENKYKTAGDTASTKLSEIRGQKQELIGALKKSRKGK